MPELFWNAGSKHKTKGLDALGLRSFDQKLERHWVGGITTISIRARYMSLLTWACAEFFERLLAEGLAEASFDKDEFNRVLRRLEAVVFFSTHYGEEMGADRGTYGVLGKELLSNDADQLDCGSSIELPDEDPVVDVQG